MKNMKIYLMISENFLIIITFSKKKSHFKEKIELMFVIWNVIIFNIIMKLKKKLIWLLKRNPKIPRGKETTRHRLDVFVVCELI